MLLCPNDDTRGMPLGRWRSVVKKEKKKVVGWCSNYTLRGHTEWQLSLGTAHMDLQHVSHVKEQSAWNPRRICSALWFVWMAAIQAAIGEAFLVILGKMSWAHGRPWQFATLRPRDKITRNSETAALAVSKALSRGFRLRLCVKTKWKKKFSFSYFC